MILSRNELNGYEVVYKMEHIGSCTSGLLLINSAKFGYLGKVDEKMELQIPTIINLAFRYLFFQLIRYIPRKNARCEVR